MTEVGFEIPTSDPCWYCHCPPGDDLAFSWEFDTFVHLSCIRDRLPDYRTDGELRILANELLPSEVPQQAQRETERDWERRASDGRIAE